MTPSFAYKQQPTTGLDVLCIGVNAFAFDGDGVGVNHDTYCSLKSRKKIEVIGRGGNGNEAWIIYETLPQEYKDKVIARYGNPYGLNRLYELLNGLYSFDYKAFDYYRDYKTESGRSLPINGTDWPKELAKAASWMNVVCGLSNKTYSIAKHEYKELRADEYKPLRLLLESNKIWLPYSYDKLMARRKQYLGKNGMPDPIYDCLIPKTLENTNSLALNDDQLTVLKTIYSNAGSRQMDFTWVATKFRLVCVAKDWRLKNGKLIKLTPEAVADYLFDHKKQTIVLKKGKKAFAKTFAIKQILERPSAPMYFVCHDGWDAELFYQKKVEVIDKKTGLPKKVHKWWLRKVIVAVVDKYNDMLLGWAIGDIENSDLINEAYMHAMQFINANTGSYHLPWEIKSDNFGTAAFKDTMVKLTGDAEMVSPITVGNHNDNPMEAWFNWFNNKYCKEFQNWSGYNITNGESNNKELIEMIKHQLPTEDKVVADLNFLLETERNSRLEPWHKALTCLPATDKRIVSRENYLLDFGNTTKFTLRNNGFEPQIDGESYWFIDLNHRLMDYIGSRFTLYYDKKDLSTILAVHDAERLSFLVPNMTGKLVRAKKDMTPETKLLNAQFNGFKRKQLNDVVAKNAQEFTKSLEILSDVREAIDVAKLMPVIGGQQKVYLKEAKRMIEENNANYGGSKSINSPYSCEGNMEAIED